LRKVIGRAVHGLDTIRPIIHWYSHALCECRERDLKRIKDMMYLRLVLVCGCVGLLLGCEGRTEIFPNSERALRRSPAEFAADSAKRFPYKADAPRGGEAIGRCQVGYSVNKLEITNLGDQDWDNVEIWVNKQYVVWLPKIKARSGKVTAIPFRDIYNEAGQHFPEDNRKVLIDLVEIYHDGKMYEVKKQLAD
jgi:hypothetical protein